MTELSPAKDFPHSSTPEPYRPHLAHPKSYRFVGYGEVEIVSEPQNPEGGEQVVGVECMPIEEASRRFLALGTPELAELYRLAAAVREARTPSTSSPIST